MRIAGIYPQPIELRLEADPDPDDPLGIGYMLGIAVREGHDVQLFIPLDGDFERLFQDVIEFRPDVVAMSLLTKHVPIGLRLANRIRGAFSLVRIVAGGAHATAAPEDLLPEFDACVIGEGELTFQELLRAFQEGLALDQIEGLALKKQDGQVHHTPGRRRIADLDGLPWPVREPILGRTLGYGISYPEPSRVRYASTLFSRGCPYTCSFCSSPQHWGPKLRFRTPESVVQELRYLSEELGVNYVAFADLIFAIDERKVRHLCDALITADLDLNWFCETTVRSVNRDLLLHMKAAGCTKICFGVEVANDASLSQIAKAKRQDTDQIRQALQVADECGIFTWAFAMMGLPWETEEAILQNGETLASLAIHQLRLSIATPLPGTPWWKSFKRTPGLSLEKFDTNWLVYEHPSISPVGMKTLQQTILRRFYSSLEYRERMNSLAGRFPKLAPSIDAFCKNVQNFLSGDDCVLAQDHASWCLASSAPGPAATHFGLAKNNRSLTH